MIVTCEKCRTRFKFPDSKITEQGTKVRCAVCQSTFQVKRAVEVAPADPFEFETDSPSPSPPPPPVPTARGSPLAEELFGDLGPGELGGDAEASQLDLAPASPQEPDRSMFEIPEPVVEAPVAPPRELLPSREEMLPPAPPKVRPLTSESRSEPRASAAWPERPSDRVSRSWTGLLINLCTGVALLLALAAVGALYVNDGKLDRSALSVAKWKSLFSPARETSAAEVSNGLYGTRAGKPVFYIRGDVENRGVSPAKLKVRAEILDGEQLVRSAEVLAGAIASPEDLYNIGSAEEAAALSTRLDGAGAEVLPKQRAPFLLTFYDYPPNLSAFHFKITVGSAPSKQTAGR
jgi:predicted Zn finger-like uncharacterized protein